MDKLTPSAQRTLDALTAGPGNVHELSERTGRSRSTTDKAINELARAGLIVKVDDGGDPADGAPARWQLATPAPAVNETSRPADADPATDTAGTDSAGVAQTDAVPPAEAPAPAASGDAPDPAQDPQIVADVAASDGDQTGEGSAPDPQPDSTATQDGQAGTGGDAATDGKATQGGEDKPAEVEPPKLCRGCQTQMPKICECCWQKTPAFCGTCRRTMPQVRRGEPGEPIILSNGLPKLRPGELEALVEQVMRQQSLPAFAGVIGWTGGRVAVHLPGRSSGAINNALEKLERTGVAELVGDKPMRYRLKPTEDTTTDPDTDATAPADGQDEANQTDTTQPAAEATSPAGEATEPQPTNAA